MNMLILLTTSWLAAVAMATNIQACIAEFAETHRTVQTDAAFGAFGTPKDIVDIVYSYVPRVASPSDIARVLERGTAAKLYVVGTIMTNDLSHVHHVCFMSMSAAQKAAADTIVQRDGTVHVFAEFKVPGDPRLYGAPYVANSCIKLSECLSVEYDVKFERNGTLGHIYVSLLDPYIKGIRLRLQHSWFFYRFGAPPTLRVFAVDERA